MNKSSFDPRLGGRPFRPLRPNTLLPPGQDAYNREYPYLWWARKHTVRQIVDPSLLSAVYPYSSESYASAADYEKLRPLFPEYADMRRAAPHSWHASEVFLYLTDLYKNSAKSV